MGWRGDSAKERRSGGGVEEEDVECEETEDEEEVEDEGSATASFCISFFVSLTVPPLSFFSNTCSSSSSDSITTSLPPAPALPRLDCPSLSLIVNHYGTSLSSSVLSVTPTGLCVCLDFPLAHKLSVSFQSWSLAAYSPFHCLLYV